jgi:hypothetical protein
MARLFTKKVFERRARDTQARRWACAKDFKRRARDPQARR